MKKIIATVLAMVMALALCTTAFADNAVVYAKAYNNKGEDITAQHEGFKVTSVKAVKDTSAAGYKVVCAENSGDDWGCKIAATAADYDLKLTADGRAPLYLKDAPNSKLTYDNTAKLFTNVGDKCEQLDKDTNDTYYSYTNDDGETTYYVKDGTTNVLVDGKLVAVTVLSEGLTKHQWKVASYAKDDTVATYKCKECGTVATVYKTVEAAEAAGAAMTDTKDGNVIGWVNGKTDTKTDTNKSPKTFDAGIAMYVGMALTSVAGSAVVIGKKKEF